MKNVSQELLHHMHLRKIQHGFFSGGALVLGSVGSVLMIAEISEQTVTQSKIPTVILVRTMFLEQMGPKTRVVKLRVLSCGFPFHFHLLVPALHILTLQDDMIRSTVPVPVYLMS